MEPSRTPSQTQARSKAPLPAGQGGIADALGGEQFVIPRNDGPAVHDRVCPRVIFVQGRFQIVHTSIFLAEAAIVIQAKTYSYAEVGAKLKLVLNARSNILGARVT